MSRHHHSFIRGFASMFSHLLMQLFQSHSIDNLQLVTQSSKENSTSSFHGHP
ncbi:hypothetical protein KC19_VG294200 [Ceratodon purpureus]|uniref:Uncharacterized protein n=1 Tax=Ceratodon purpureus TaxID=3225 RepID=A0A8T0HVL0_CERPU|nr:hypothetical protein KC19_VG294200 [Ceratodon purpureus]